MRISASPWSREQRNRLRARAGLLLLLLLLPLPPIAAPPIQAQKVLPPLRNVHRILFLGDSITYSGGFIDEIELYLFTHFPENKPEIINLGLPSETVSGLSEEGHAGRAFPRPDLHERLERALDKIKPDMVVACYGMNDGIYYPFSEDRFRKFREGYLKLEAAVKA